MSNYNPIYRKFIDDRNYVSPEKMVELNQKYNEPS